MGCVGSRTVAPRTLESRSIDRDEYYRNHPGLHNPPGDVIESIVSTNVRAVATAPPEVLQVSDLDLSIEANTKAHHTDEFDITYALLSPSKEAYLVVRRGQPFEISVDFNRPYNPEQDDLRLVFTFGKRPMPSRGSHVEFVLSAKDEPKEWGALILSQTGNSLKLKVMTPPTCAVGRWKLKIDVVKKGDNETTVYRYNCKGRVYILFNPWCKDDQVYMPESKLLEEYIMNETGKIYSGSYKKISPKPWNFGQFEGDVLDCCMYLLDSSSLSDRDRGNPVRVARKISAVVNAPDDSGVLIGNWSGDYEGGTSPLDWSGSVDILQEYNKNKTPVKYGQCWVFSGVVTTVCRALGIPARSVTNFASAHDTDGSITIDIHFDSTGKHLDYMDDDSVWNFHVWNDVWMARPDLPTGYGGWQAIDATPQETSDGVYCMGPMSLLAIRRGEVNFPYDGRFVFAEVNADKVYWVVGEDSALEKKRVVKHRIGRNVSTKSPASKFSWDREDVTSQYKFPEGSEEERAAVRTANLMSERPGLYDSGPEDVTFELSANPDVFMGDDVEITLKAVNTSEQTRTLSGRLSLSTMYYTGVHYKNVDFLSVEEKPIEKGQDIEIKLTAKPEKYLECLADHCICRVSCMIGVKETRQIYTDLDELRLRKPHLTIKAPESGKVGEKFKVDVTFKNPLPVALTNCELKVEGPGLQKPVTYKQPNVENLKDFSGSFEMTPAKKGEREIVVYFNSKQISAVTGSHTVQIQ